MAITTPGVCCVIATIRDGNCHAQTVAVDYKQLIRKGILQLTMDIDAPIKCLGPVAVTALQTAILAQAESAWQEQEQRQQAYDVHHYTQSIVMLFTDGSGWPNIEVSKQPGWDRLVDTAVPLMHDIVDRFYPAGGTIIRAMAAKLLAGAKIKPHRDSHPSFHHGHRIHVPITTNNRVRFMLDGRPYKMEIGQAYEINNQLLHSVMNKGKEDRITFIFDYVPPELIDRTGAAAAMS